MYNGGFVHQVYSPNMLKTFELCPRKYEFRYIRSISMPSNDDFFEFGKNIHALAAYYLKNENIDKMEKSLNAKEMDVWNYLKKCKYFSYEVINTEYNLLVKIGKYFYGGRLDALVKNEDIYYILDYKTGSVPKNPKYDYQTMIYMLAVKNFFKTDNLCFVYIDLKKRENVIIEYSQEMEEIYNSKLIEIGEKLISYETAPKRINCNCEYSLICN